jgi:hypothetical protein
MFSFLLSYPVCHTCQSSDRPIWYWVSWVQSESGIWLSSICRTDPFRLKNSELVHTDTDCSESRLTACFATVHPTNLISLDWITVWLPLFLDCGTFMLWFPLYITYKIVPHGRPAQLVALFKQIVSWHVKKINYCDIVECGAEHTSLTWIVTFIVSSVVTWWFPTIM